MSDVNRVQDSSDDAQSKECDIQLERPLNYDDNADVLTMLQETAEMLHLFVENAASSPLGASNVVSQPKIDSDNFEYKNSTELTTNHNEPKQYFLNSCENSADSLNSNVHVQSPDEAKEQSQSLPSLGMNTNTTLIENEHSVIKNNIYNKFDSSMTAESATETDKGKYNDTEYSTKVDIWPKTPIVVVKDERTAPSSSKETGPNLLINNNNGQSEVETPRRPVVETEFKHHSRCPFIVDSSDGKRFVEPTVSRLEREIILIGESSENRRGKILQLPPEAIPNSPSHCESEIVGDDVAKTRAHILCECDQPGVTGGAVPVVTSFIVPENNLAANDNKIKTESNSSSINRELNSTNVSHIPRLIPKLSNSYRSQKLSSVNRTEKQNNVMTDQDLNTEVKYPRNISFKTTSLKKYESGSSTEQANGKKNLDDHEKNVQSQIEDKMKKEKSYKKLMNYFTKHVSRLAQEASHLSEIENPNVQVTAVDSLYKHIVYLKKIANDLKIVQSKIDSEALASDQSQNLEENQASTESNQKSRNKDNRIYIKFLPSKSAVRKRKSCNSEAQTDLGDDGENLEPDALTKSPNEIQGPKEVDSMDGMFIPSSDEPPIMDEDDDEDGMDITITFPELQSTLSQDSHLSVCFSNISAEALGRLKRCPKEFTLRMDFIQGRMFFQSGRSPANNFSIGPDLKITECIIDNKRSDIINIKPSTECLYTSQIIPVEGATRKDSVKILKSTDSELFNVVSLPFINKRNSVATKSCMNLKNLRRVSSESLLPDRMYYKSMPQIPSLTKILEEPTLETAVIGMRGVMVSGEKKPRNRCLQKKRTNASLENILHDTL